MRRKYKIIKKHPAIGDKWIQKIERKAFGWSNLAETDVTTLTGYKITSDLYLLPEYDYDKILTFGRFTPYSHNFIFKLIELLERLVSGVRQICAYLAPALVLVLIIGLIGLGADWGINVLTFDAWAAGIYFGGLIGGSLVLSLFGFLCRKIFKIDDKLAEALAAEGYFDNLPDD